MALFKFLIEISYLFLATTTSATAKKTSATLSCNADSIPKSECFGTSVTKLEATEVRDWATNQTFDFAGTTSAKEAIDFCNVTVTYTHPGLDDEINVYVWLPLEGWNGRFIAQGGGGWAAGAEGMMQVEVRRETHTDVPFRCPRALCPSGLRGRQH